MYGMVSEHEKKINESISPYEYWKVQGVDIIARGKFPLSNKTSDFFFHCLFLFLFRSLHWINKS